MGVEREKLKKTANRYLARELSNGQGLTVADMIRKVNWEFGLSKSFVLEFLDIFEPALKEDNGVYQWKA